MLYQRKDHEEQQDSGKLFFFKQLIERLTVKPTIVWSYSHSGDFQQFDVSSDDEFDDRVQKRTSSGNSKAKRVKECPGCGANVAVSTKECRFCDYQFTSKSLLVNQQSAAQESQSIRDRFPFEPERVSFCLNKY